MLKTPLSTVIGGAFWTPKATILGGASKTFSQIIQSLFASGEQGFVYDPNDLTTMFQDAAGTVPVTGAGQPVGLMLDKSKSLVLGSELKQSALARVTGTAPVATYDSTTSVGTVNRVDISNQSFIVFNDAVGKKWYKVSITNNSAALISLRNATMFGVDATLASIPPNTTFSGYVYVVSGFLLSIASSLGEGSFTVNSIKEIAGNHAYQTTSASRPILRQNATTGAYYLEFDGTDDYLIVAKDNLKFLHDGTSANGFVGFKPSGNTVYHPLLNTGNLGSSVVVGYVLSQDDRVGNGNTLNMVANGSGTLHVHNAYTTGISANPRVVSFKNMIGTHALRLNGAQVLNSSTETGTPSSAASANDLWIGRAPAGFSLQGNLYGVVCINRFTTASETLAIEKELAKRAGATLSV